ncbi:MAG: DNA repair protein RecN [Clostridia bacterium]|nr:DNA repair protein RecN [Clostridia bacterium]
MISNLHIKNIGIIDDIEINFNNGFNVLTGETGAGKTLIIDALKIIAGGRFSKEMIRTGETHSLVEACIFFPESTDAEDGNIIISREVFANGRNTCKVNGRLVTVSELKEIMQDMMDIHGQADNQKLMDVANHIQFLDNFFSDKISLLKIEYAKMYEEYCHITEDLNHNLGDDIQKQRMLDLLNYQLNEIEAAHLVIGEEDELESKRKILLNSEKISQNLNEIKQELNDNALDSLDKTVKYLSKIESFSDEYHEKLERVQELYYELEDVATQMSDLQENVEFDQELSNTIEKRLDVIFSLKRKYGNSIEEILRYQESLVSQIEEIENKEEYIKMQKEKLTILTKEMRNIALQMNEARKESCSVLEEKINQELFELEMKNAKFSVCLTLEDSFNKNGLNKVEFLVSTNIGDGLKPLTKIASGGEISRIMLAIKVVLSDIDNTPIMIFDEIDTGISGIAAMSVSSKIKNMARNHQIICVTHLAVVAAKADHHYYIKKEITLDRTKTIVKLLSEEEAISEIARISSGEITKIALQHAQALRSMNIGA